MPVPSKLILASSSPYRKQLLARLQLDFDCRSPEVDESVLPGEDALSYVRRLAETKARAIARDAPSAVVIGSDQCALLDGRIRYMGRFANGDRCGAWTENQDPDPPGSIYQELKQEIESMGLYPPCPEA